jgi:hypothetical protein
MKNKNSVRETEFRITMNVVKDKLILIDSYYELALIRSPLLFEPK